MILFWIVGLASAPAPAIAPDAPPQAVCFVEAYPQHLCGATATDLVWCDGTRMPWVTRTEEPKDFQHFLDIADLRDQTSQRYPLGAAWTPPPPREHDPGRLRSEAFFRKMYGDTALAVERTTERVPWFGQHLRVTTVNDVHTRLVRVRDELSKLPKSFEKFYKTSAGTFVWRAIKGTRGRLSMHSFAIAIDVGVDQSDYWQWNKPGPDGRRTWKNRFPAEVVEIFEKNGFIWGGKWDHFDTMHFEYRPELLHPACADLGPPKGP